MTQHNDHIWLTIHGETWAIKKIERRGPETILFHLWRGYDDDIENTKVLVDGINWDAYCKAAVEMLEQRK